MKNKIKFIIFVIFLTTILPASGQTNSKISIDQNNIVVSPGEEFTINVKIEPGVSDVFACQYDIYYDNAVLTAINQKSNSFLSQDGATTLPLINTIDDNNGIISYGETRIGIKTGIGESGVLSSITFNVKDSAKDGESSTIELKNIVLSDATANNITDMDIENGIVEVSSSATYPSTKTPLYDEKPIIGPHLQNVLDNTTDVTKKIPIIVIVQENYYNQSLQIINSFGENISNVKELWIINAIALEATPSVIFKLSELEYVNSINLDLPTQMAETPKIEDDQVEEIEMEPSETVQQSTDNKSPGFGGLMVLNILLLLYLSFKRNKGG